MRTLKQNEKRVKEYPWIRPMTTDEKMGRAINRLRFKSRVWDRDGIPDYDYIYEMVCGVRKLSGLDHMSRELFDEGIQYCNIFSYRYERALAEFRALCWIDW